MPPRARARTRPASGPTALSEADVALLRERLDSGKKPRVMLLVDTALGAAGTSVPVVGFSEPAVGEFISIRLRDDVVPFSPAELSMPVRGRRAASLASALAAAPMVSAALPLEPPAAQAPASKPAPSTQTPQSSQASQQPSQASQQSSQASQLPPQPSQPSQQPSQPSRPARLVAVPEPAETLPTGPTAASPAPAKSTERRRARSGGLSVTLRFGGQGWTYESTRSGRRSAARPLNLAAVRAFADRLDDPALRRDLQGAIDVCRQQAQTRAETLRAELERVEIELADLDE